MSTTLRALAAFARLGWREAAADRLGLLGRALLFSLPVLIFAAIWRATPLAGVDHDADRLTWYVMVTEAIVFSPGYVFREIEEDIRTGAMEAALVRPLPYALARIAEEAGGTMLRLIVLGIVGTGLALATTAEVPVPPSAVPALLICAAVGALLALLFQVAIGLLTAWIGTPAPVYWIWQKLLFVFGGLFLPLTLYPAWVRDIGVATPGAAILFHPASLLLDSRPEAVLRAVSAQAAWLVGATLLVALVSSAATRRFVREGV
jgi:ABC-2 type transport system permease protein